MRELKRHQCPRCGGGIPNDARRGEYIGALSRIDNETEICSACGTDEAMRDLAGAPPLGFDQWWVAQDG